MLFAYYDSMEALLRGLHPEYPWQFTGNRARHGYWADVGHQRQLLDKIGQDLGIKQVVN
jgi:hypothetical protein